MAKSLEAKGKKILKDTFKEYLSRLAFEIRREIINNFDSEKDVDGDRFKRLKKPTEDSRKSLGFHAKRPILRRTGKLRNSISVKSNFKSKNVEIISSVKYAKHLNDGRSNMDPRRIIETPKILQPDGAKSQKLIAEFADKLEKRLIKNLGLDIYINAHK